MPLLHADKLGKYFGGKDLFHDLDFALEPGERVAMVGANGEGKTTILRMIIGEEEATSGRIHKQQNLRLGYLPQVAPELGTGTLWECLLDAVSDLRQMEAELDELAEKMAKPDCGEAVRNRYAQRHHEFELRGGYTYENRIETVLSGLAFTKEQHQWSMTRFSGGWRTRAWLARLLLSEPDLLLLDEPTNHLDLDAVKWLESFLREYPGSLLIVSHDRQFLDGCCNRVWELAFGELETYKGNYSAYLPQRAARYADRLRRFEQQQAFVAKTEEFIARNIAGQRSNEAKGRRTRLERFKKTDAIEAPQERQTIGLRLEVRESSGERVLETREMTLGYDASKPLARMPDIALKRGDCLAVLGPNGCGKSTMLRTFLGRLAPLRGQLRLGTNVHWGYLSQTHENLEADRTVLETIAKYRRGESETQLRSFLGGLLLRGDDVFRPVSTLSGGQRSRLALGCLALAGANLLALDEPTNHLDIPSQEILEGLLANYEGTIVLVTHDRYLARAIATQVLVFAHGAVHYYPEGWDEYLSRPPQPGAGLALPGAAPVVDRAKEHAEQKKKRNELKRQRERLVKLETEVLTLETKKARLHSSLAEASAARQVERLLQLTEDLKVLEARLEAAMEEWATLSALLDGVAEPAAD